MAAAAARPPATRSRSASSTAWAASSRPSRRRCRRPCRPRNLCSAALAQYVAPDPTAAAAADGGARIEEGVEESKSTEPPVSLKLDNCTVSRAAERLLIELAIDMAAAPAADPAERCRAYLDKHYPPRPPRRKNRAAVAYRAAPAPRGCLTPRTR